MTDSTLTTLRVVCPDGHTYEVLVDEPADHAHDVARAIAAQLDRTHDEARCDRPHRIEQATWHPVERTVTVT